MHPQDMTTPQNWGRIEEFQGASAFKKEGRPPLGSRQCEQFDVKLQGGIAWNHAASASGSIAQICRNDQSARTAHFHARHAFVPAADHHASAQREDERVIAVFAGVEFVALLAVVVEPSGVVHGHALTRPRCRRIAGQWLW